MKKENILQGETGHYHVTMKGNTPSKLTSAAGGSGLKQLFMDSELVGSRTIQSVSSSFIPYGY